jgi:hypothetical protein
MQPSSEPEGERAAGDAAAAARGTETTPFGVVSVTRMIKDDGRALIIYARAKAGGS